MRPTQRSENSPALERISFVAPDIVSLTIQAGHVIPSAMMPYRPQPGDEKRASDELGGKYKKVVLLRNGKEVGWLLGPKRDTLVTFEELEGDPLLDTPVEDPASYTIRSEEDVAFNSGQKPTAVYRKSKPIDWAQPGRGFAMRHTVYLKLPRPLTPGKTYALNVGGVNVRVPEARFTFDTLRIRSEAVHAHQIGYRPDDPVKCAFLSVWLGTGGPLCYPDGLKFHVVQRQTGKIVYTGRVERVRDVGEKERLAREDDFHKTNVYRMDFSGFKTPGRYHISVEGVGASYYFLIGPDVWKEAFTTQMRGLYNQRSGIALGPPTTEFRKPRDFHPQDGQKVYRSTHSILDGGDEFELAKYGTKEEVPDAWGGYHDAGDWNPRRATHLRVTIASLELFGLFPATFEKVSLNIPKRRGVPDVLTEALFEIDCWRRLQRPDGGIPFGIETEADPIEGEVSWNQSMPAYVFAPDPWSSFLYANVAGRAARLLQKYSPALAKTYHDSALRAMEWGDAEYLRMKNGSDARKLRWEVKDDRCTASVVMFALTNDTRWHEAFLDDTVLKAENPNLFQWGTAVQRDAAFAYACLRDRAPAQEMRQRAVRALEAEARKALDYASGNVFNLTTPDRGKPLFLGYFSTPDAIELARAHFLTGKAEYLKGLVQATQFAAGCNPNNMTYTTGLGANPPANPLKLDSRRTGQPAPEGLTVYGNFDFIGWPDQQWAIWPLRYHLGQICKPSAYEWPLTEAYFDIFLYPATNEFTVDIWDKNIYVWGYLAARR